jgi:SOS-response transcriptional repressor LexA
MGRQRRLNQRMRDVFEYIVHYETQHPGASPSVREIMEALNISTSSVVAHYLDRLEDVGVITRIGYGCSRGIIVVGATWSFTPSALHADLGLGEVVTA